MFTCGAALVGCSWRDSVLTVHGSDGGGIGVDGSAPTIQACPAAPGGPSPLAPVPTAAQVAYQRSELAAFLHFGLNTFDGTEYGNPATDTPSLFNPTDQTPASGSRL